MTIKNQIAPQKCKRCGAIFVRQKSTAKYCSGTCREAYNHQMRAERRRIDRIINEVTRNK